MSYIVVWKNDHAGKVWTVEDAAGEPVRRDLEGVKSSVHAVVHDEGEVLSTLGRADGTRIAIPVALANSVLGWDLV